MAEDFEKLLAWLAADREDAGRRYEEIRRKLIGFFIRRACSNSEELADKTFERVEKLLAQGKLADYQGEPLPYCYGVARIIFKEDGHRPPIDPRDLVAPLPVGTETEFYCLDHCLAKLEEDQRYLIIRYYDHRGHNKIKSRQLLADELGITMNNLRLRAMRIRAILWECVMDCVHNIKQQ